MAVRDKSQNVGFVYTNIYSIYKKAKAAEGAVTGTESKVIRADELTELKITKFQPKTLGQPILEKQKPAAQATAAPRQNPFDDLKANLNRLQDLHSRLRFMLHELEDLVNKK